MLVLFTLSVFVSVFVIVLVSRKDACLIYAICVCFCVCNRVGIQKRCLSYLRYLCLFAYSGVQHILCCVFCFVCLRLEFFVWWFPTHIVLCFFYFVCLRLVSSFSGLFISLMFISHRNLTKYF